MIPLFTQIDKYKRIVEKKEKEGKSCDIIHIAKSDDRRQSAFLIQDMFPITDEYIEREYTIAGNHLLPTSEHTSKKIEQKAKKVMAIGSSNSGHLDWKACKIKVFQSFFLLRDTEGYRKIDCYGISFCQKD